MPADYVFSESNPAVRASRAGDRFHYCWAAKRSLLLLHPKPELEKIAIERDDSSGAEGEYSLDMTEVYRAGSAFDRIKYQFKYSVKRLHEPFVFSELKKTIVDFSDNYWSTKEQGRKLHYVIVSNRGVSNELKSCVETIAKGKRAKGRTADSFYRNVKLNASERRKFCSLIEFRDAEGDLEMQFQDLRVQAASFTAGNPTEMSLRALVDMVACKALPGSDGIITQADVLSHFCRGATSMAAFYPAPARFDAPQQWIETSGFKDVRSKVLKARRNVFIHAPGGVGKTVTLRMLASDIPSGSAAVLFDCFASGEYANPLQYRHTPEKACVQIVNELAVMELCNPLVVDNGMSSQSVFEAFFHRIECAVGRLRRKNADARLYLFVDAADNAHMMADETREPCFADYLLGSSLIDGCTVVFSARTERMKEFWPDRDCEEIELAPFTPQEVGAVLRQKFNNADPALGNRLYVRTSGLPRIVAGILSDCRSLEEVIAAASFAPIKDYDSYLEGKYRTTRKRYSGTERKKLERLCRCLVLLPPNVPIKVLGTAAKVSDDFIVGFISDWERPLWHSQEYVHFRDEPTETWFRTKFGEDQADLEEVIDLVSPLSDRFVYVARSLPGLLLRAKAYDKLVALAESDESLPDNIHIAEKKQLRLERLRFAVCAMIRSKKYAAAMRLSLLAGGMVSESGRRKEMLRRNLAFATRVFLVETVEELAATRQVELSWPGSENLCTGVLLSSLANKRDEAAIHIDSALQWLMIHLDAVREKTDEKWRFEYMDYALEASLFGYAILAVDGPEFAINHMEGWNRKDTRFRAASFLADDCVSLGEKVNVEEMLCLVKDKYIALGLLGGAMDYGYEIEVPQWQKIARLVQSLSADEIQWDYLAKDMRLSVARFAVWIARQRGGSRLASGLLEKCVLPFFRFRTYEFPSDDDDALPFYVLSMICRKKSCSVSDLLNKIKETSPSIPDYVIGRAKERFEKLLPVYIAIVKAFLSADGVEIASALKSVALVFSDYRLFQQDKRRMFIDAVSWLSSVAEKDADCLLEFVDHNGRKEFVSAAKLIELSRRLYRRGHMKAGEVCLLSGTDCFESFRKDPDVTPDELSELNIRAAMACYPYDPYDARGYFSEAFNVLSKCGDELLPRWTAVTAIARRLSQSDTRNRVPPKFVYDFTRCGEYVRKCVDRDKYYNHSEVLSILTAFNPSYSWATYSRWRDRGVGSFCGDLKQMLEGLLDQGAMTVDEAWSFRAFNDSGDNLGIADLIIQESSRNFKQKVYNDLILSYGKTGCSQCNMETLTHLAEQLGVKVPTCLQIRSDQYSSPSVGIDDTSNETVEPALASFDGKDPDWTYTALTQLKHVWNSFRKRETFFSKVPNRYAYVILQQLADDKRIRLFDANELIVHLPDAWRKKPGVKEALPKVFERLMGRCIEEDGCGYVNGLLACSDEFGIGPKMTEVFLNCMANGISLGGTDYFRMVKAGLRVLTPEEMIGVFSYALQQVADGMDSGFGDGEWISSLWPDKPFEEVTKDVLWTAMGDPSVGIRWKATHCVLNELLRAPKNVAGYVKCLARTDFSPCVSKELPTYVFFSRMHFLLALAKAAGDIAPTIRENKSELIAFLRGQDHVLIRYIGWKALRNAGVHPNKLRGINPVDDMTIQKIIGNPWNVKVVVNSDIKHVMDEGGWFPMDYDFEKYWLHSLANVFGLEKNGCDALLRWAATSVWENDFPLTRDLDPRNDQFYDDRSTSVSDSGMPDVSDYCFYVAYHSLLVLAGKLLKCQPVLQSVDDSVDRFSSWMERLLPVFTPDLSTWQADVRENLPVCVNELKTISLQQPLHEIDINRILQISKDNDRILVEGKWQIGDGIKTFECSLSCSLVSRKSAESTRKSLTLLKDPTSLALPTLFDNPNNDQRNHGEYEWRGLFDSGHDYPSGHLDEKDPAAGGLHLVRFQVAQTIYKDLHLKDGGDYISVLRRDGNPALVSWYWSDGTNDKDESSGTRGRVLAATFDFLSELCQRYRSELIIELVLRRYSITHQYGFPTHDNDEQCYRYALFSPHKGLY